MTKIYEQPLKQKTASEPESLPVVQPATLKWGETEGEAFRQDIQESFNQILH